MKWPLLTKIVNAMRIRPADPQQTRFLDIGPNNVQVPVNTEIALMVSAVWACGDCIAKSFSASDWNVYGGTKADEYLLPNDRAQYMLNTRWNQEMTAQSAKRALMIAVVFWGNGYAEIIKDGAGRVVELWPIPPDRVELLRDRSANRFFYRVQQDTQGAWVDLDPGDVLHIKGPGVTGLLGDNPIAKAVQSISLAIALDQFSASYFANGTQLGGYLTYQGELDEPRYQRLKEQLETRHRGVKKSFRPAILEGGMSWTAVNSDAERAQLIEAKYQSIEEICRWFGTPPHKIAHLLRATFSNIEHLGLEFVRDTLRPYKIEIEQECDYKIFPARGEQPRHVCIDLDWASQGDFKTRMEAYSVGRGMGVYSANDILRKEGENPIPKSEGGDARFVNSAAILLKDVGKNLTPAAAPAPAAPPTTTEPEEDDEEADDQTPPAPGPDADAVVRQWVFGLLNRLDRRRANRQAELQKHKNKPGDPRMLAEEDAMKQVASMFEEIEAIMTARYPANNNRPGGPMPIVKEAAARVVRGQSVASATDALMKRLKG